MFFTGGRALGCKKLICDLPIDENVLLSGTLRGGGGSEGVVRSAPALLESLGGVLG